MEGNIAEIRYFAGNFAPRNWALCFGQVMSIAQNTALFSLLGTTYGGNGQTTFALPDFRSRIAVGPGQGPGLSNYSLGQLSGSESYTIGQSTFPQHGHSIIGNANMNATAADGIADSPQNTYPAVLSGTDAYATAPTNNTFIGTLQHNLVTGNIGAQVPVGHRHPTLCLNFIICLQGVYPSRN